MPFGFSLTCLYVFYMYMLGFLQYFLKKKITQKFNSFQRIYKVAQTSPPPIPAHFHGSRKEPQDFPRGPVAKMPNSQCSGPGV